MPSVLASPSLGPVLQHERGDAFEESESGAKKKKKKKKKTNPRNNSAFSHTHPTHTTNRVDPAS
eukprot:NODE_27337_length_517_cov_1.976923.p3 GENE.NODE_27337_length_517_cov_1.976923~~NODE_27337_length_517_cov_1.976923.p3  ORF type:complete len:64 (-),score=18.44 NODE_27337_length_517_cov_1.976923:69-260(-)